MKRRIRIRLAGLAALGAPNQDSIKRLTGFSLEKDGNDWVVFDDDPVLRAPPKAVLSLHSEGLPLTPTTFGEVAAECVRYLHPTLEAKGVQAPKEVTTSSNLGLISELEKARNYYFWEKPFHLKDVLERKILPGMAALGAKRVYPVLMDSENFYSRIALPKISYLNRHHGLEIARDKILNDRVLDAALPSPLAPLDSLEALLFLTPYAFAIPLHRPGSALLFTPKEAWQFPPVMTSNIFDQIGSSSEPFETNRLTFLFHGGETSWRLTRELIQLEVESVNRLTAFFSDPLNFLSEDGEFDELRLLKANSLLRLMIADVKAINMTNSSHAKSRLVFQFIDKIANLLVEINSPQSTRRKSAESDAANRFYLPGIFDELKSVLGYHGRLKDRRLGALLVKAISRASTSIHDEIQEAFAKARKPLTDEALVAYFRTLRNLGHGTFLQREQFEGLFLELNPVIPSEYHYLPWMILLAMGLAPEKLLQHPHP